MTPLGPTFADELRAAGLVDLPISWSPDGTINHRDELTAQQNAALDAVIAAHDPTAPAVDNTVDGLVFLGRLTSEEYAAVINAAAPPLTTANRDLARFIDMLRVNGRINVTDASAIAAKAALVAAKLFTQQRADVIFAPATTEASNERNLSSDPRRGGRAARPARQGRARAR